MQVDLTITISAILSASAVISPMLTAFINNKHQRKMKKMEYEHENEKASLFYKRGIFEDYLHRSMYCLCNRKWITGVWKNVLSSFNLLPG